MAALIQGFPKDWNFAGKKTPAYRQVGNAFPAPVAKAIGLSIKQALKKYEQEISKKSRIKIQAAGVFYDKCWNNFDLRYFAGSCRRK